MAEKLTLLAYAIPSVIVVLGIMIVIHELGHHLVAKFFGVRVEVFSVGFGKRLWGFRKGETDYRLSALPFGGYVKMAGENPMEERTGDPGEFSSHPRWQRVLIALAGPAMNILLAITILTGVNMVHYRHEASTEQPARIGYVDPKSPAAAAGLQAGDLIVRINSVKNPLWQDVDDVLIRAKLTPGRPLDLGVQRGNEFVSTSLIPAQRGSQEPDYVGWDADETITVVGVKAGFPAEKAGLKPEDKILAVDGRQVRSISAVIAYLQEQKGKPVTLQVDRAGQKLQFALTPIQDDNGQYLMGFSHAQIHVDALPFGRALEKSLEMNKRYSLLIVDLLQKMIERKVSLKQVDGPIGIARVTGEAVRQPGWIPILFVMAIISLNLGIFNLLPIPILDGGLILMLAIEGLIRRDISQRIKERVYQTAFVFLVLFAVMVIFNDITKIL
jgi:regulator of sigma E protease